MAFTYGSSYWCQNADGSATHIYQVRLGYELQSQDQVNNSSVIKLRLQARSTSSSYKPYGYSQTSHIDGTSFSTATYDFRSTNTWQTFATTGNITVNHNADGTYTATKSGYFTSNATGTRPSRGDASVSVVLPTIARASSIAVNDANIGASTNITINKANSSFTTTLEYSTDNSNWTQIVSKTENQVYGWTVPTSFYALIPNSQTLTCYFRATTYSGDTNIGTTTTTATFTATGNPTINSATATDTNNTTTSLTGDNTKMVKYASNVQVSVSASGQNSATITAISVNGTNLTLSGTSPKTGSITFNATSINVYTIVATDSRGYTTTQTLTMDYVDYIPLTINATIKRNQPTDGNVNITFNGNYYSGDFATGTSNTLAVEYRYQEAGGSWSNWTSITNDATISGNTYSGTKQVSSIDYTKVYYFDIRATDEVQAKSITNITVPKGVPIFNWDNDEVDMNVLLKYGQAGREDYADFGFKIDGASNMRHKRSDTGDNFGIDKYDGTRMLYFWPENGNLKLEGKSVSYGGIYSREENEVGTPYGHGTLVIKRANNTEAPNNGVVLEYGNSTAWTGQLFIGDNADQGIWFNGWSNGTRGTWRRLAVEETTTGSNVVSRSSGASLNSSEYRRFGNVVQLVLACNTTASTNTGSNCFAGTINDSALIPKTVSAGISYSASSGLIGSIDTSGNIVVRVVGSNLATNRPFTISFTYVI